ncbi:MAG: ABC transporter substrate-binding protein [Deltaproteobacteria bacterium]|jgi:simple sugar transport system substrate-binding protein|nr:ABC transporter substrate-binding protein [Deltaproteobacteria bacterium]
MRKVLPLLCMFLLVSAFALYAETGVEAEKESSPAAQPALVAGQKLVVIGFAQVGAESDWRMANTKSMRETFTEKNGYKLILKDAQQKQKNQIAAIRAFIKQKVDYILLAPVTEQGWDNVLREAKAAAIPVIILDRMIKTSDSELYTCWIGSDFRKEGDTAALWMEKTFKNRADLKIAHIQGNLGSSAQIGRTEGLEAGVSKNAGWKVVARDSGNFTQVQGKEVMERFLSEHSRLDVIYCENDNMAFGAMKALDDARIEYGLNKAVSIISFDATRAGLKATLAGKISYNVECNPLHGPRVEKIIRQMINGKTPSKIEYVDEVAFDAATITQKAIDARAY